MMKKIFYILNVTATILFSNCRKYDHAIDDIEDRLDKIEGISLTTIDQQITAIKALLEDLKDVDTALQKLIDDLQAKTANLQSQLDDNAPLDATTRKALEAEIANIKAFIAELQAKDAELDQKISNLENYVDSKITATEDWANATFATLTQYEDVQTEIAAIKALIEQCKTDITAEYTTAIADAVQDALDKVDNAIAVIQTDIEAIKSSLTEFKNNFAKRIQSLIFVPQYSDGKIKMDYTTRKAQAHFRISPAEIAKLITAGNVKAFARYTNDPTTRASYEPEFPLAVTSASGDETGMLEVNIAESGENPLSTNYWTGQVEAIIYIQITDDNGNDVVSQAIPMIAHGYVANTNSISGYSDGGNESGEASE